MQTKSITAMLGASIVIVAAAAGVGIATHSTSGGPATPSAVSTTTAASGTPESAPASKQAAPVALKGCEAFSTQNEANAYLKMTPAAKSKLDSNGNGIACEAKFAPKATASSRSDQAGPALPSPYKVDQNDAKWHPCGAVVCPGNGGVSGKPFCPTNQGPISGDWCMHSANGPDNPGYVPRKQATGSQIPP